MEVRSSPVFEEKTEFKFDSNALGADANLAFMRLVSLDGVARAFSTVCWTSAVSYTHLTLPTKRIV